MFSTNIVFCLMLVGWDFVHSDEVPSQGDKIRQRFSFLDQLDSLLKSYKYDDNDSHLPTLTANANSVKSNNLLATTTTVGNNRPKIPLHSRLHLITGAWTTDITKMPAKHIIMTINTMAEVVTTCTMTMGVCGNHLR